MGPSMAHLLTHHWDNQQIAPKAGRFLGKLFGTGIGITQGDPTSPMIFNIMVDAVARAVLSEVYGPPELQHSLGWSAGERNLVFYADDVRIAGQYHIWVQDALTVTVAMFKRVGLKNNMEKTKSTVCNPGYIWGKWSKEAYKHWATREGAAFRERNLTRISCAEYTVPVVASSMKRHMEKKHGGSVPQTRKGEIGGVNQPPM